MNFPIIFRFWPHLSPFKSARLLRAYRKVFSTDQGKIVLHDILREAGYTAVTAPDGPLAYNEGGRRVAHHIVNIMRFSEEEIADLVQQAANLEAEFNQAQARMTDDRSGY